MRKVKFETAVDNLLELDSRYKPDAYYFLRDALDYTVKSLRADELVEHRHVSGKELMEGLRKYALEELGSMSLPVLDSWGVRSSRDIGEMVFNLIQVEAFGKAEDDHPTDFEGWMSFEEAFQKPFRPTRPVLVTPSAKAAQTGDTKTRGTKPATTKET